ncbi:serine/arginine repetitive matrix protein 1-like [Manacus candei]|uniref:serine/arginine repetitive matrix protein 1-like n=1 Tax=Manacus candei TaxID=415023 RepID=UPI002226B195|nr:serine/arginine repetitive matrix protein 1-like [Manacus candei]
MPHPFPVHAHRSMSSPARSRRAPAARQRPGARSGYLRGEAAKAWERGTEPLRPRRPPGEPGPQPRGGSGAALHLPPRCRPPRPASRELSRPEPPPPPPRLPRRRGADQQPARGRDEAPVNLPPFARSLAERKEGRRGHRRGESRGRGRRRRRRRKEGGRGPPAPPPSPHRQESAICPPRGRSRRRGRSPATARLLSPARTGQCRARRRAPAPQSTRYRSRAPPGRAGRGGAGRSAAIRPPPASARGGHSLARAHRPLPSRRRARRFAAPPSPPAERRPRDRGPSPGRGRGVPACSVFNGGGGGGAPFTTLLCTDGCSSGRLPQALGNCISQYSFVRLADVFCTVLSSPSSKADKTSCGTAKGDDVFNTLQFGYVSVPASACLEKRYHCSPAPLQS